MLSFELFDTLRNSAIRFLPVAESHLKQLGWKRKKVCMDEVAQIVVAFANFIGEKEGAVFNLTVEDIMSRIEKEKE